MKFTIGHGGEVKIITVFENAERVESADELYKYLKDIELFTGKLGEVYSNISHSDEKFILLGLGKPDKLTCDSLRKAFFNAGKELMKFKVKDVHLQIPEFEGIDYSDAVSAIAEGLVQSKYSFEKYLSEKKTVSSIEDIYLEVLEEREKESKDAIEEIEILMEGVFLARDLVNEPAMHMTPSKLANSAKIELEELGVDVKVYGRDEIENLGMEAFLAVSRGSSNEPKLIVMNYNGDPNSDSKLALVGKGLTYDSGGYSIKPSDGMVTMHSDMAGSAAVIGALKAIATAKLKKNIIGVVAACENMISGVSYKPGDIIGSMSGKTIEVLNTDAEGRLTLADALWYSVDVAKADQVIDIATLTGACVVALGDVNTGAITNDDSLMDALKDAAKDAGEPVWELPTNDEYKELIKGDFADIKNVGGRGAGAITAGLFLKEFVDETPWVHLDIAGTSYLSSSRGYLPKGATGVPVKTLYYLAKNFESK